MDPDVAIERLREVEAQIARLHALQAELLVAAAAPEPRVAEFLVLDPRPGHDEERRIRIADAVREEIACALRWTPAHAQDRIDAARLLAGPLSPTRAALARGDLSLRHVTEIVDAVDRLPGRRGDTDMDRAAFVDACTRLQDRVLPVAARSTVPRTRAAARRALLAIDGDGQARRRRQARCTRDVYVVDDPDGISTLIARLATEQAHAVMVLVRAAAQEPQAEITAGTFTMGERRADALTSLVLRDRTHPDGLRSGPTTSVRLDVVVGLDQLLGDDPDGAVELRGAGSVSMGMLCALLADPDTTATMRRLVVEPTTGHLLDIGRGTYQVPPRLREYIALRDRTCRFPGCARRADLCQVDHAQAWDEGGATSPANLGALCVRHHQLKTHGDWHLARSRSDGTCTWISPSGRHYAHHPPPL